MNPWFEEKAPQVDVASMFAFGIRITTRHSKATELAELLMFAAEAAKAGVNLLVIEALYDSGSQCCAFELRPDVDGFSPQGQALLGAALKTISQFEWMDQIHHGRAAP